MEAPGGISVGAELAALGVHLPGVFQIGPQGFAVVVGVNEVVAGVVGRVYINHLHLAQIRLLQQLEHFEVVALNNQVLAGVEVALSSGAGRSVPRLGIWMVLKQSALPGQLMP